MTTSNSVDFSLTRDQIIQAAALETGDVAEGDTLGATSIATYALRLNSWVKSLMANGSKLWAMKQATLFLSAGTAQYSLGSTGDNCANTYVQTTLSTDEVLGSVSIGLTAFTGMSSSDNIGIVLDSGEIYWTTISGAPGSTTTISVGLPSSASSGNVVFTYTTNISRPQRIDGDAMYWRSSAGQDTPVKLISRSEYAQLSNKSSIGKLVQAFYDPQLINGQIYVWPTPDNSGDVLRFWYDRIIEDFDTGANTPDFAIEWGEALILGLASRMAPSSGMPMAERQDLERRAAGALLQADAYSKENVSTFFQPDSRWGYR